MSDYISREALIDRLNKNLSACNHGTFSEMCYADAIETVKHLPAADVEPVRHGRWECVYDDNTGETDITCSHCKNTRTVNGCFVSTNGQSCYFEDDYCPSCGAKMDLEGVSGKEGKGK